MSKRYWAKNLRLAACNCYCVVDVFLNLICLWVYKINSELDLFIGLGFSGSVEILTSNVPLSVGNCCDSAYIGMRKTGSNNNKNKIFIFVNLRLNVL